ncbi:hypothetical protein Rhopal_006461-T1 [Rhodotorula paludigena]|uniref:Uncharacterized protein n=1 Tax=Rhodotorula paludigena TaxID=86838 RepID=A0AAV5GLF1_9BASI|nr:hypothetical protein Rhopal_006461-T1 [Rhodotorula paludigena]
MARTRTARARSPAATLDAPPAAPNEPTISDPSPSSPTSPPPVRSVSSPDPPKPKRKRPVEPKFERVGALASRKKRRVGPEAGEGAVQAGGAGDRMARVGEKYSPGDGQMVYVLTAPMPERDAATRDFIFEDWPEFRPNLSPEEIIRQGAFDGGFFRPVKSQKSKRELHEDWTDFPSEWYAGLDTSLYLTRPDGLEDSVNKWQAHMGQPYEAWEKNGWLRHDARQVQRWKGVAGETGRFRRMLYGQYRKRGVHFVEPDEEDVSPGIRQTLNHWAYDPNTDHLNRFREEKGDNVANDDAD